MLKRPLRAEVQAPHLADDLGSALRRRVPPAGNRRAVSQLGHGWQVAVLGEVEIVRQPAILHEEADELLDQRNLPTGLEPMTVYRVNRDAPGPIPAPPAVVAKPLARPFTGPSSAPS